MGRPDRDDQFRLLADTLPQIVWIAGPDGRVEYFNQRWTDFTGLPVGESLGDVYRTVIHPDDLQTALTRWQAALASGTNFENEHRFRRHDGVYRWHLARAVAVTDAADRVVRWFGTCTDIDDQRRAIEALGESERRQRFLADLATATQPLTDPREVMAVTARMLGEHLEVDRCAYAEIDGDGPDAVFDIFGDYTRGVPSIVGRWPVAAFGPEVVRLMVANEPYVLADVDADPRAGADLTAYRQTTIRAVICVPLHKAGRFTAAMAVHQNAPRYWTTDEVELVVRVVDRCWESIERVRAARALAVSETRFRQLVEQSPLSIQRVAPDGRSREVNRAWEEIWGVPRADHLADYNLRLDPQLEAIGVKPAFDRVFAGEAVELPPTAYVPRRGRFAGRQRWVRTMMYAVKDDADRVDEVVLFHEDVTDRREVEAAQRFLAEAGEVLAASMDAEATLTAVAKLVAPRLADWCGVYVVDGNEFRQVAVAHTDPAKVEWAREIGRRFPPRPEDARGVAAVVRSGDPEFVPEVTDEMLAAGVVAPEYLALVRGLGLRSIIIVPLTARGRTLGAITVVAAESGRRYTPTDLQLAVDLGRRAGQAVDNARLYGEAQEALRLLRLLIDAAGRLTGAVDAAAVRGAILDLSHQLVEADAHAVWRYDPDADAWFIAGSAGLSDGFVRDQGRVAGAGTMSLSPIVAEDVAAVTRLENRRAAYQSEGIVSLLAVPMKIHGAVEGTIVFYYRARRRFDDVTVRVAMTLADLAGSALGTAELYERERELRRAAEEADRRKDEFLAMLGHELRNPLAPIRTGLQLLGWPAVEPAARTRTLEMMDRQVHHLIRLVDDLLDVSRITRGKVELKTEPVDLGEIAARAAEAARPLADARGQVLTVTHAGQPVRVLADPVRLVQVIGNLLHNAVKYTPEGGRICLSVEPAGEAVQVRVADTGAGIPADMLPRVFDLFIQVDRTIDRSEGGLGIGLTLVRSLTEMHGGTVEAFSAGSGKGSEFVVRLPVLTAHDARPEPGPRPGSNGQSGSHRRVLVVDDNRDVADSLADVLRLSGHEVRTLYDGLPVAGEVRAYRPQAVVLDIGLPGMDGYEVARRLRTEFGPELCLLAVSGYGQDEDRRRAFDAGFDHHLTKPADPAMVAAILARV
jgi:PAS domain S-box-containing protein